MNADDIVAINQIMSLYGHYMDQRSDSGRTVGRAVDFGEVFTEDLVFTFAGQTLKGRDAIENMTRNMPEEETLARSHHVTNVYVYEDRGETLVHAKWLMPDPPSGGMAAGDYHIKAVRMSSGWRIRAVDARVRHFPSPVPVLATE